MVSLKIKKEDSFIKHAYYCEKTSRLVIRFRYSKYVYSGIPLSLVQQFESAESQGSFFNSHIRNKFTTNQLSI